MSRRRITTKQRLGRIAVASPQVGWVVDCHVRDPGYDRAKARRAVLVRPAGDGGWFIVPFTTQPRFKNGEDRVPVPNPHAVGCSTQAWLKYSNLSHIPPGCTGAQFGVVDRALVQTIADHIRDVTPDDLCNLLMVAKP